MRRIAAAAGVCAMTVSLALRNHRRVSEPTRRRIQKIAREMGYVPNPLMARLNHELRSGKSRRLRANVACLHSFARLLPGTYAAEIAAGAANGARELGYGMDLLSFHRSVQSPAALRRVLRGRGIEGLVLLPMEAPADLTSLLPWAEFSAVTTTLSVVRPALHGAIPDQFSNSFHLCERLLAAGRRRVGLVTERAHDVRVGHRILGGVMAAASLSGLAAVRPLVLENWEDARARLTRWFADERPDALLSSSQEDIRRIGEAVRGHPMAELPKFATGVTTRSSGLSGVYENPHTTGTAAMEKLAMLLQRGEKGVPAVPLVAMVPGELVGV